MGRCLVGPAPWEGACVSSRDNLAQEPWIPLVGFVVSPLTRPWPRAATLFPESSVPPGSRFGPAPGLESHRGPGSQNVALRVT